MHSVLHCNCKEDERAFFAREKTAAGVSCLRQRSFFFQVHLIFHSAILFCFALIPSLSPKNITYSIVIFIITKAVKKSKYMKEKYFIIFCCPHAWRAKPLQQAKPHRTASLFHQSQRAGYARVHHVPAPSPLHKYLP